MADGLYVKGLEQFGLGDIHWDTDTIKLAFMSTSYTPNYNTHQFYSDISASVASGTTDLTLSNAAVNTATDTVRFDTDDDSDTGITASTDKIVIYKDTGVAATSPLIGCFEFVEGTLNPISGTLAVTVPANGFFALNSA